MSSQLKLISKLKASLEQQLCGQPGSGTGGLIGRCCCRTSAGQNVLASASQHSTLSKQARQQLRRASFVPEQKLEELRDLRIKLDKDKQEWQAKFDRMQEQLLNERRELDLARERLKHDQQQVANEREQLYRKLDVLKEKGILLSPSHKVIITTPSSDPRHYQRCPAPGFQLQLVPNNNNNHASSIQIQGRSPAHLANSGVSPGDQQQPPHHLRNGSTSLFIESSNGKVPLHLSENGDPRRQQQQQPLASSFSLSKVPLIGSPSNSLLAQRFGLSKTGSFKLESQVI